MLGLVFSAPQQRRELLQKVTIDTEAKRTLDEDVTDDLFWSGGRKKKKKQTRRTTGTLGELSGGQDMAYIEQKKSVNKMYKSKPSSNAFFKKMARDQKKIQEASQAPK